MGTDVERRSGLGIDQTAGTATTGTGGALASWFGTQCALKHDVSLRGRTACTAGRPWSSSPFALAVRLGVGVPAPVVVGGGHGVVGQSQGVFDFFQGPDVPHWVGRHQVVNAV